MTNRSKSDAEEFSIKVTYSGSRQDPNSWDDEDPDGDRRCETVEEQACGKIISKYTSSIVLLSYFGESNS